MAHPTHDERFNADELFEPQRSRSARRLPQLLATATRIARVAAPRDFKITTGLQLVIAVAAAIQVFVIRGLLNGLIQLDDDGSSLDDVAPWLLAFIAIAALLAFSNTLRIERQRLMGELVARYTTGEVLDIAMSADLLDYETPSFYNRLQRARVNASARPTQMVSGLLAVGGSLMAIVAVAAAVLFVAPLLLVLILIVYVPLWLVLTRVSRAEYRFAVIQTERDRRRQHLFDVLSRREEAAELRAFGHGDFIRSAYDELYDARIHDVRELVSRRTRLGLLGALGNAVLTGVIMLVLVWLATTDRLSPSDAGAVAGALLLIAQRLSVFAGGSGSLYESALFMEDYTSFISASPSTPAQQRTESVRAFEEISIDNVGFTYPSRTDPAVYDVTMRVRRGAVVALVGENGSGKTTLAKMLAGLLPAQTGSITWDDVPAEDLGDSVRESVGVVFQDYAKYLLTVRDNVTIGRVAERNDDERFLAAVRRSGADIAIEGLPAGADTQLGTEWAGGVELSVGQWQRIAIARGYFRDAPFLILDEPTASLDPRAEAAVFDSIRDLYEGRTVLLISHRFSSVRSADHIYVMSNGTIIEHGSHDELMARTGTYHDMFTLQAARYLDDGGQ